MGNTLTGVVIAVARPPSGQIIKSDLAPYTRAGAERAIWDVPQPLPSLETLIPALIEYFFRAG